MEKLLKNSLATYAQTLGKGKVILVLAVIQAVSGLSAQLYDVIDGGAARACDAAFAEHQWRAHW